jgi:uncharacterized membrane protein YfcA
VRLGIFLSVPTTIGAIIGVWLSDYCDPRWLFALFSFLLGYSAILMFQNRGRDQIPDSEKYQIQNLWAGFSIMGVAGVVSGLLGIGSGILKVPAMDTVMKLPIKVSSATSNFMIGFTAAAGAAAYLMKGAVLPVLAVPAILGVFLGAKIGAKLMTRLPAARLRGAFSVVLIITAVQMAIKAFK